MLKTSKSITVTGQSFINGVQVAHMQATINTDGTSNGSITKNIINQELYNKNKADVRVDMDTFEEEVYEIEDGLVGGNE
ncbi:hypothetical protein [Clostridium intestinale]|uniref:Prophage protein n=1 Tax=Clostridium intestinale TaxID=36845 RepID=A0A7D6VVC3_9CLOT|nr:hypothetical protein [Clostridium intestinale]QLY81937.1 hypothetical protein HZF06_10230 [Clostridium intestinale]